ARRAVRVPVRAARGCPTPDVRGPSPTVVTGTYRRPPAPPVRPAYDLRGDDMTRTWRLRLLATLGSLALVGTLACTTAPARVPEIAAQQAETRAHDARLRAEQAALQAETADLVAARQAAQTAVAA